MATETLISDYLVVRTVYYDANCLYLQATMATILMIYEQTNFGWLIQRYLLKPKYNNVTF